MAKKSPTKPVKTTRSDGWVNPLTGLGTSRDKRTYAHARRNDNLYDHEVQEELWETDDILAKIVSKLPKDSFRAGFELKIHPDDAAEDTDGTTEVGVKRDAFPPSGSTGPLLTPPAKPPGVLESTDDDGPEIAKALMDKWHDLCCDEVFVTADEYERAYGGSVVLVGVNDGQTDLTKPLNEDNIKSVDFVNCLASRELIAVAYYSNPGKANFGRPMIYRLVPAMSMLGTASTDIDVDRDALKWLTREIHESRLIVFPGPVVTKRHRVRNRGWGNSIFVRVYEAVRDFQASYGGASAIVSDFAQAVWKVAGLADAIQMNDDKVLSAKLQQIDLMRSISKAILIDKDGEEFERKSTTVTGLSDLLERFEHRVATAADMPVSILFGRSPGGLNANGENEQDNWYETVAAHQDTHLASRVKRFFKLCMLAKNGPTGGQLKKFDLKWHPLQKANDKEEAEAHFTQAQADQIYLNSGVLSAEEIAKSRFAGGKWSSATQIDFDARETLNAVYEDQKAEYDAKVTTASPAPDPNAATEATKPKPDDEAKPKTDAVTRNDIIREEGGKWCLYSHEGKKLGTFETRAEAEHREQQIEYFKHAAK